MYKWKTLSQSITIKRDSMMDAYKPYGFYVLNGIKRFRNYKRHLKNGKGLNFMELLQWRIKETEKELNRVLYYGL